MCSKKFARSVGFVVERKAERFTLRKLHTEYRWIKRGIVFTLWSTANWTLDPAQGPRKIRLSQFEDYGQTRVVLMWGHSLWCEPRKILKESYQECGRERSGAGYWNCKRRSTFQRGFAVNGEEKSAAVTNVHEYPESSPVRVTSGGSTAMAFEARPSWLHRYIPWSIVYLS